MLALCFLGCSGWFAAFFAERDGKKMEYAVPVTSIQQRGGGRVLGESVADKRRRAT
jgi:hypothetical protein